MKEKSPGAPKLPGRIWLRLQPLLPLLAVFIISATLLCWNLGARYLWEDEAYTAVSGQRMMSYGRPLAYDGRNLLSSDAYDPKETEKLPTGDPAEAIRYYIQRGDFKADTAWTAQPWGPFVVAGASLALFGHDTVPARLPFALAGALTAALLYAVVRRRLASPVTAVAAAALVLGNSFWVMHMRQCRYYALSSLFLLVTLEAYLRWSEGRRWGGPVFIGAAWVWFQMDYGSLWPVLGILGLHAVITRTRRLGEIVLVFTCFCAVIAPFCFYYELAGRTKYAAIQWSNVWSMLFEVNQFQLPLVMVPVVLCLLWINRKDLPNTRSLSLVGLSLAIVSALTIWMALVGPFPYYRYIVPATTLSAIVVAYGIVELARLLPRAKDVRWLVPCAVAAATLFFSITNLPSWPGGLVFPEQHRLKYYLSSVVKPEIRLLIGDLTDDGQDDPNRATVEFLRQRLKPGDEILCNYEDKPLMFYLPNRVRGGVSCFRVTDAGDVRFAVYRQNLNFCHTSIYLRELRKNRWRLFALNAPDIPYGNFPDPQFHHTLLPHGSLPLQVLERVSQ